jgi:hypothetical protein
MNQWKAITLTPGIPAAKQMRKIARCCARNVTGENRGYEDVVGGLREEAALVQACDVQIAYGLTGQSVATNNPDKGTQALGTVSAEMFYDDAKGIALELQAVLQKAVNWAVELRFGQGVTPPSIEFDVESRASFADLMSALDRGVPVSRSALYDQYKLPRPVDEADAFVKPAGAAPIAADDLALADPDARKKKRRTWTLKP